MLVYKISYSKDEQPQKTWILAQFLIKTRVKKFPLAVRVQGQETWAKMV